MKKTAKEKILFRFEHKVKQLLEYPFSEKEIEVVEEIWDKLDELMNIKKQIQSNRLFSVGILRRDVQPTIWYCNTYLLEAKYFSIFIL